jgi:hypothetical protein
MNSEVIEILKQMYYMECIATASLFSIAVIYAYNNGKKGDSK